jgi:hypothetical protein
MEMSEVQSNSIPPSDTCLQSELQVVCRAFDRGLDHKWENFCTEFKQLWGQFQKECIQSSQKLVLAEKEAADVRYDTILSDFNGMKAKLGDLERYNQLLQEKLDSTQEEMKSLSAVSMTIQWEKRVTLKQAECQRLTQQVEKLQKINTTLKRENTLLNTQLEQWNHEESLHDTSINDSPPAAPVTVEWVPTEAYAETPCLTESQPDDSNEQPTPQLVIADATEHTNQTSAVLETVCTDNHSTEQLALCEPQDIQESDAKQHLMELSLEIPSSVAQTVEPDTEVPSEPHVEVTTEPQPMPNLANDTTEVLKVLIPDVAETPMQENTEHPVSNSVVGAAEVPTEVTTPLETDESVEASPTITYTVKKLKRKKTDESKTTYLLGSNNVLYTWTENDQPGEEVGVKSTRGYKFHKK